MSAQPDPLQAPGQVLSTLNSDGSRRWIRPKPSLGRYHRARRRVAILLMFVFFIVPYLRIGGKPIVLLDVPRREFTLFGATFLPTDSLLFMLLLVSGLIAIFLVTALFGRVWCGWACPQTVYMEFLFRPVERWLEGGWMGSQAIDRRRRLDRRRLVKHAIYVGFALFLAHTFLAYFVGVEQLAQWVRRSPVDHPTPFLVMLTTTALVFLDFAYFREQTCLVACPYGRLQSVLLDRRSTIVGYDAARGEPRRKGVRDRPKESGDCIDCRLCVITCPTGIDIREGLQMECIHCTQCMDACDRVMTKIGKPAGLIRYGSRDAFLGRPAGILRARVVLYPLVFAVSFGMFLWNLNTRAEADVTVLRGIDMPYRVEADGSVVNQIRVKVRNRDRVERRYAIELLDTPEARLIAPINPLPVPAGQNRTTTVFVVLPRAAFPTGERAIAFRVSDGARFAGKFPYELVGPRPGSGAVSE